MIDHDYSNGDNVGLCSKTNRWRFCAVHTGWQWHKKRET